MIRHAIAATVTAATLTVTSATFLCLDPYHVGIMAGVTVMCCGWVLVEALRARAEYDAAAPAALRGWALDPEDEAAPAPRCWVLDPEDDDGFAAPPPPPRVLSVERAAPLVLTVRQRALPCPAPTMRALPGPSPLLMATDAEYADWLALYAAWTGPEAEVDAATQAEIAAWEWDDPGEW